MAERLLLVGWEAADWRMLNPFLDAGEMPCLNQLVENGSIGDLPATQPLDRAAQWTSIATGKRPWRHGITHSREYVPERQQFVPVGRHRRRAAALWEILARQGLRSVAVGWPATHGSEPTPAARVVSDRYSEPTAGPGIQPWPPALEGTYSPADLGRDLDALRVSPEAVGVDVISKFVPRWGGVDQQRDLRLSRLRVLLAADLSHHVATARLLKSGDWDFAAVRFPALGHIARLFMPFTAPRRAWIDENDFNLYQGVVKAACRLLDQALAGLRQMVGAKTTLMLVSAHGVQLPDFPPAGFPKNDPEGWKSPFGIFVLHGPGIVRDGLVHGASVLDVAPTILTRLGLPIADDMEGRALMEAFEHAPAVAHTPTYEVGTGEATGVPPAPDDEPPAAKAWRLEMIWNLARSCLEAGRSREALPALEQLFREFPERAEFAHALFQCQLHLNELQAAGETLDVLNETLPPGVFALLPRAELALARREIHRARELLHEAIGLQPRHPAALRRIGLMLLQLRDWKRLADLAQDALKQDDTDPIVWLGLAQASLRLNKPAEAERAAQRAIQLKYFLPDAHFVLSRALLAQNKWDAARDAMAALLKLQPDNKAAASYNRRVVRSLNQAAR